MVIVHSNGQLKTEEWRQRERMSKNCSTAEDYLRVYAIQLREIGTTNHLLICTSSWHHQCQWHLFCLRPIKCQQGLSLQGQRCLWSTLIANVIFKCFLEAACQEDGVSGKKYCKNWVSRTCGKYTNFCKSVTAVVLIGDFKGCENSRNVGLPKTCQKLPNCTKNLRKTNENYRKTYLKLPKSTENLLKTCTGSYMH